MITIPESLEKQRITVGPVKSNAGDQAGTFMTRPPKSGDMSIQYRRLLIQIDRHNDFDHVVISVLKQGSPFVNPNAPAQLVKRMPNYSEICYVKDLVFGPDDIVFHFLPPRGMYLGSPFAFHMWTTAKPFPTPPVKFTPFQQPARKTDD